ncbi:MAG TPA: choice-of-anchor tandem repeat GloVer-containing protein [Terriglobia bacterium]|nr:choice-of-anchor tandem repeat GloVer-containing protein [Terriglobia bacterium]
MNSLRRDVAETSRTRKLARALITFGALLAASAAGPWGCAQNYSVIYSFQCGTDGSGPFGNLIADSAGNLYGTTLSGGALGYGTVYKVTPGGTETVLHSFAGPPNDGESPYAGLVLDKAGNLYGTTFAGGSNCLLAGAPGCGTVFEIPAGGTESLLYSFGANASDAEGPLAGLLRDGAGNLYGTTAYGGAKGGGAVFRVSASGKETVLHSFAALGFGGGDGSYPVAGVVADGAGNLYGTTGAGGASTNCLHGCGTVFEIEKTGQETVLYSFAGAPADGSYPDSNLLRDRAGNLYGVTQSGGQGTLCGLSDGCGTVFRLAPGGTETVLFGFDGENDGDQPAGNMVKDARSDLYGTSPFGGSAACLDGCGILFELGTTGREGALHKFAGPPADGSYPGALLVNGGGLYGSTANGGADSCGTVFKITP